MTFFYVFMLVLWKLGSYYIVRETCDR